VAFVLFGVDNVRENQLWHLIVVSRAGQNAREVTEESGSLLHFIDVPAHHSLPWSPDGEYLALLGSPIRIVRLKDGRICTFTGVTDLVGFVECPSLVLLRHASERSREFRGPNCLDARHGASTFGPAWIRAAGRIGASVSRNHRDSNRRCARKVRKEYRS
jgi:hypothetical protein